MDLASISVAALLAAIILSCTSKINVGFVAVVMAWIIGVYLGGMRVSEIVAGFPAQLFLTLVGVTLLFAQAQVNGTLDRLAHHAVRSCGGNVGLIPVVFFLIAAVLASIGAGNIAAAALIAPMAMATAGRIGVSAFLMTIMVGNGANAGALSPFAPTGVIVNQLMNGMGLRGVEGLTFFNCFIAHATVGFGGYLLLGGWRLFARAPEAAGSPNQVGDEGAEAMSSEEANALSFKFEHWMTVAVVGFLIMGVILFGVNVGMGALAGAILLALFRMADEGAAVRAMPWGPIMMVSGVTVLIGLLETTGGLDLFTDFLARFSTQESVTGVVALVTGLISAYSSTSGVVLPAFLPTVPGLIERLGGGDPLAIASAMNVGAHLVDVSPLSTIGALCIAAAPHSEDYRSLFNKVLAWGLSMSVIGALICYLFFGLLW